MFSTFDRTILLSEKLCSKCQIHLAFDTSHECDFFFFFWCVWVCVFGVLNTKYLAFSTLDASSFTFGTVQTDMQKTLFLFYKTSLSLIQISLSISLSLCGAHHVVHHAKPLSSRRYPPHYTVEFTPSFTMPSC